MHHEPKFCGYRGPGLVVGWLDFSGNNSMKELRNTLPIWGFHAFTRKLNYNKKGLQSGVILGLDFGNCTSQVTKVAIVMGLRCIRVCDLITLELMSSNVHWVAILSLISSSFHWNLLPLVEVEIGPIKA